MAKPADDDEGRAQYRVTIDPDLAAVLVEKSRGKKRGYASQLVNRIIRERFVQLGWIGDDLTATDDQTKT